MSTNTGRQAEQIAATFLEERGFIILAKNWRTRWCEIDLVATKPRAIYFVEVKYRQNARHGLGLDYITAKKLAQMHFAAEFWMNANRHTAEQYRLAAVEVSGSTFEITEWLDDL